MATKKDSKDLLNKAIVLGSSLVYLGKGVADDVVSELEKRDLLSGDEGKDLADKIRKRVHEHKDNVKEDVVKQLRGVIDDLGIATKEDVRNAKRSVRRTVKKETASSKAKTKKA